MGGSPSRPRADQPDGTLVLAGAVCWRNILIAMPNYASLSKAPVVEAIIEIKARMARPTGTDVYAAFQDRWKEKYPTAQQIRFVATHLHFNADAAVTNDVSHSVVGVRLDDEAGQWVVQGKSDGLTVSRLTPYESWERLVAVVQELWPTYVELFRPEAVLRLGVRYINMIPLPDKNAIDLDAVLTAGPKIPAQLSQDLSEFMTRLVLPVSGADSTVTIQQALGAIAGGEAAGKPCVVLDIDAACEQVFGVDSPEMWTKLADLRNAKNLAFFSSLTAPTLEQFK